MEGLIELENPNRVKQKMKKVSQLDDPTLGAAPAAAAAAAAPAKKAAPGDTVQYWVFANRYLLFVTYWGAGIGAVMGYYENNVGQCFGSGFAWIWNGPDLGKKTKYSFLPA